MSAFHLSPDALCSLYETLRRCGALPWYADGFQYTLLAGQVLSFRPIQLAPDTYPRETYEQAVQEILDASLTDGMSQIQIARTLHDDLISRCTYDTSLSRSTPYDAIVHGTATCSGYAGAYLDLMNRAGVPCMLLESDTMNHAWNLVFLDGQWYHVDTTWDDPLPDVPGRVLHQYFLKTHKEISALGHSGWEQNLPRFPLTSSRSVPIIP